MVFEHELIDNILKVNCLNSIYGFNIEDSDTIMEMIIDKILQVKRVERVILAERREYEYDYDQTKLLLEIADVYDRLTSQELDVSKIGGPIGAKILGPVLNQFKIILEHMIKRDPIGAYVKVRRLVRQYSTKAVSLKEDKRNRIYYSMFVKNVLEPVLKDLEKTQLISLVRDSLYGHVVGDRNLYREIFNPLVRPIFMLTRYVLAPPKDGRLVERYELPGKIQVEIYRVPHKVRYYYHITAPEFSLSDEKYAIIDSARRQLAEHKPGEKEFTQPERARETFMNIGKDMINQMAAGVNYSQKELEEMVNILVRYTAGFGILEILLTDGKLQDVYINSPIGITPIYVQHDDYEECETNLIPTKEDAESWATRFRLLSGRPLDEANPVLDTELFVPGGRARVAAITKTLSPDGIAYALRRHRDKPWTYPLFIDTKYMNSLFAGLMSFMVDGSRSILFAGGRSSGKSSLLGATLIEIMKKFRVISVEDSVTGDSEIIVERGGQINRTTVGKLIDQSITKYGCLNINGREILDKNPENIKVFSMDKNGKIKLSKATSFIRHKVNKDIYKIETRTGRKLKVTQDHSLFTLGNDGKIETIKGLEIKPGTYLVTPRVLPINNKKIDSVNILDNIQDLNKGFIIGDNIQDFIIKNFGYVKIVSKEMGYSKSIGRYWKREGYLPVKIYKKIKQDEHSINEDGLFFQNSMHSKKIPVKINLDQDFLAFVGLWLANGCYDKRSIIISVVDPDSREIVKKIAERFNLNLKYHTDGFSLMINSDSLKFVLKNTLELNGNAYTKRIPPWVFELSKNQISSVLKGIFSGDGYITQHEVAVSLVSEKMVKDIQTLLLQHQIIARINNENSGDKTHSCRISNLKFLKIFYSEIGFLQKGRMDKLSSLCQKISTHDTTDIIPLSSEYKKFVSEIIPINKNDYLIRQNNIGREKLNELMINMDTDGGGEKISELWMLANSDIFWDEVRSVEKVDTEEEYVYDFSVPENENFVCENILAHNTLELPIVQLRNIGYNVERMKSRSVITRIESELPADDALRTALRLGDSCLIVGEVRSVEARALFEAMRIGALANVVAGTIHGESAYGVFDRVVNDLGVTSTSFKAIDIIVISGMIKSGDGLHRYRRILEVAEVRKHWKDDPIGEKGFVTLMEYSAKDDQLKPTDTLLNGESFVINEISKRVKDWHGNWEAVWDNIELRAKIKQTMVDYANKMNNKEILEADTVSLGNEIFHMVADEVRKDYGVLDSEEIFRRWDEWFKNHISEKNEGKRIRRFA